MSENTALKSEQIKQNFKDRKLNPEDNTELKACIGACGVDTKPEKVKILNALSDLDRNTRAFVKGVGLDTTITEDNQILQTADAIDVAQEKFNGIVDNQISVLKTNINAAKANLFENNYGLGGADEAILANSSLTQKILDSPITYADNSSTAPLLAHLNNMDFIYTKDEATSKAMMVDMLNRKHSPDVYNSIESMREDIKTITSIQRSQSRIFGTMRPAQGKVEKIRANKFKGGSNGK